MTTDTQKIVKKTFVSLITCLALLGEVATPAYAAASSYMNDSVLGNVTPGGVYEDVTNNSQYLYGGNVVFKFKNSSRGVPPIFSFAPPKIKAGCNGISFTGGFLQVLGLDGLADQIQNAGTAVVYGIIVGLIYSLPALEKVFSHIRQWAEWLQNMLKGSCQQGMAIGKAIGEASGMPNAVGGMMNDFDSLFDAGDKKGMGLLANPKQVKGDELATLMKSIGSGSKDGSDAGGKSEQRSTTAVKNYEKYYTKIGFANLILHEELLPSTSNKVPWANKTIVPSGELEELYTIVVNIFGDISIDDESIEFLNQHNSYMQSMVEKGTTVDATPQEIDKFAGMAGNLVTVGATEAMAPAVKLTIRSANINPERAARFFVFGSSDGVSSSGELVQATVMMAKTPKFGAAAGIADEMLFTSGIDTTKVANIQWKGLFETAKAKIDCEVTRAVTNAPCANTFPLVLPGARNYIKSIKDIEIIEARRQGQTTGHKLSAQSSALRDDFAQHEAFFYSKFMLNYIESEIVKTKEKVQGADLTQLLLFEASFRERKKEIQEHISKIITEDGAILDALTERFKRVDEALKKANVKGYN